MKKLFSIALIIFSLALCSCAAMPSYNDVRIQPQEFPEPVQDKALVYFYRESRFMGGGVTYFVEEDGTRIGALFSGSYFYCFTDPGEHTFSAETEAVSLLTLNTEAGKEYYVEGTIGIGMMIGIPKLNLSTKKRAMTIMPDLELRTLIKRE